MTIERIVDPTQDDDDSVQDEQRIENILRPTSFSDYVGQERIKKILQVSIDAAKNAKNR
jgi:Holliday junction DNA helicase RuvB